MRKFLEDREHWVIAPREDTRVNLQKDIEEFLEILIFANYGKFTWDDAKIVENKAPKKWQTRVVQAFVILVSLSLLIILFSMPNKFQRMGVDTNILTLIALGVLIIMADKSLEMGLIDGASSFIRAMKDLK